MAQIGYLLSHAHYAFLKVFEPEPYRSSCRCIFCDEGMPEYCLNEGEEGFLDSSQQPLFEVGDYDDFPVPPLRQRKCTQVDGEVDSIRWGYEREDNNRRRRNEESRSHGNKPYLRARRDRVRVSARLDEAA